MKKEGTSKGVKERQKKEQARRPATKETLEFTDESGARIPYEKYSAEMDVADLLYGPEYKELCGACPEHGKRLSCPPYSPFFPEYVGKTRRATVICVRFPHEFFAHSASEKDYLTRFFGKAGKLLVASLLDFRARGRVVAGSGPCLACKECAAESGSQSCPYPDRQIYSLESLGVNVADLCKKAFDLDLEWSSGDRHADHVCAVGAAFDQESSLPHDNEIEAAENETHARDVAD